MSTSITFTGIETIDTTSVAAKLTAAGLTTTTLTQVNIANSTSIGAGSFSGCSILTTITFSNGGTSAITTIGSTAFLNCSKLVTIGNLLNAISGANGLSECHYLIIVSP
jgi:hypothetical protein